MKQILLWLVGFYRRAISPYRTNCCRFSPTCSQYALEALELHGALWGSCLTVWRILRCNPLCKAGYDPVPQHKPWQKPPMDKPTDGSSD